MRFHPGVLAVSGVEVFERGWGDNPTAPFAGKGDFQSDNAFITSGKTVAEPRVPMLPNRKCDNGDILGFTTLLRGTADSSFYGIALRRSTDDGATWSSPELVYEDASFSANNHWFEASSIVISNSGRVHLLFVLFTAPLSSATASDFKQMWMYSDDNGLPGTWSVPEDISATTKKSGGTTAPFDETDAPWTFIAGSNNGIVLRNGDDAGRILVPMGHRYVYTDLVNGTAWFHCLACDNDEDWYIIGGTQESVAANDDTVEPWIAEYGSEGEVYVNFRMKAGTARGYSRSTDGGVTWANLLLADGDSGRPSLRSYDCQGSGCGLNNGDMYTVFMGDIQTLGDPRQNGRIAKSSDGGLTWTTPRDFWRGPFGYSAIMPTDQTKLLLLFEASNNVSDSFTDGPAFWQYILPCRIATSWVTGTARPLYAFWPFSEGTSGAMNTAGQAIKDHGTLGCHAKGGAGGSYTADGASFAGGTTLGAILAQVQNTNSLGSSGNHLDPMSGSWCMEILQFASSAGSGFVFTNRNPVNDDNGMSLGYGTSGRLEWIVSLKPGASSGVTVLSDAVIFDGTARDIKLIIDRAAGLLKMYINGALQGGGTAFPSTAINQGKLDFALGCQWSGSAATSGAAFTCGPIRITRGIPDDSISISTARPTLNELYNYTPTTPATAPSSITGLKLWLGATSDGMYSAGLDTHGGWDKGVLPLGNGIGVNTFRDVSGNKLWRNLAANVVDSDAQVGKHFRCPFFTTSNGAPQCTSTEAATRYDFVQDTGVFTFCITIKMLSNVVGALFDTCDNTSATPGFSIVRNDNGGLGFFAGKAEGVTPTLLFSSSADSEGSVNFAINTWLFVAVRCNGPSTKAQFFVLPYSGSTPPTFTATPQYESSSSFASVAGAPFESTLVCSALAKSSTGLPSDARWKNLLLYDTFLTHTQLNQLATFSAEY